MVAEIRGKKASHGGVKLVHYRYLCHWQGYDTDADTYFSPSLPQYLSSKIAHSREWKVLGIFVNFQKNIFRFAEKATTFIILITASMW